MEEGSWPSSLLEKLGFFFFFFFFFFFSLEGWRDTENPPKMVGDYSSTEVACDEEEVLQGF